MNSRFTRWALGAVVAATIFGAAGFVQASALTSTQISAILSLLASFGATQNVINDVTVALGGQVAGSALCVDLSGNLTLGSTGGDVMSLQNYLIQKGYLDAGYNTGYYGFLTAQAVGKLQLNLGILSSQNDPAFGIMGPQTRSAVACGSNPPQSSAPSITSFTASPSSIMSGQSAMLSWSASSPVNGSCAVWIGAPASVTAGGSMVYPGSGYSGSVSVSPTVTTTYSLWCAQDGKDGSPMASRSLTVTVTGSQPSNMLPTLSVTNVSGFTVTVQYANLPGSASLQVLPSGASSHDSAIYTQSLGNSTTGTANLALPSTTPDGQYNIVVLDMGGNIVQAKDAGGNTYPLSTGLFTFTGSKSSTPTASIDPTFSRKDGTNSPIYVTGMAIGTSEVEVFLMPQNYLSQYGSSYTAAQSAVLSGKDGFYSSVAAVSGNGSYMAGFNWMGAQTTFTVLVYDFTTKAFLAQSSLTTSGPAAVAPSCTASVSPPAVQVNQLFTLNWTSSGIANVAPSNQIGPSAYMANHNGTTGIYLPSANGSQQFYDDKAETMQFSLGTGGVTGGAFVQYCSAAATVTDTALNNGTTIDGSSLGPRPGTSFNITGKTTYPDGSTLLVVIVPGTYAGNRDYNTVMAMYPTNRTATVTNGAWSTGVPFGPYSEGTQYTVLVYNLNGQAQLQTTGLLYVTNKG